MKFLLLIISQTVLFSGNSFAKYSVCDEGNDCTNIVDSSGKMNGIEVCKSGEIIRRKVSYKNDLKDGMWECFDQNGKLTESQVYKNDKKNGLHKLWQAEIKKFEECEYKDDELNGVCTVFQTSHSEGKTKVSGIYKTHYKNGIKHGLQTTYDADEKPVKSLCYNQGQLVDLDSEPCKKK